MYTSLGLAGGHVLANTNTPKSKEPSPLQDSFGVRQKGPTILLYPDPPPLVPDPESIAAQAAYTEALLPMSAPAGIVSRHWGPPRACYRVSCCE